MRMIRNAGSAFEEVYEGTPEELAALRRLLDASTPLARLSEPSSDGERLFVSPDVARSVLTRLPLSREQRAVVQFLYEQYPKWVWATDLQKKIGYNPSRFAGLMGAFGRRLTHTPGYVSSTWLFDTEWNAEKGCNRYRLPSSVHEAYGQLVKDGGK
jgi:predicted transcriptional regulator with HTH domain